MAPKVHTSGAILLIRGFGGSLGAVIEETGRDAILAELFSAEGETPVILSILLAWLIAAVLHLAIGGCRWRHHGRRDHRPGARVDRGRADGHRPWHRSGAVFALQVNSHLSWMFRSLLGLSA